MKFCKKLSQTQQELSLPEFQWINYKLLKKVQFADVCATLLHQNCRSVHAQEVASEQSHSCQTHGHLLYMRSVEKLAIQFLIICTASDLMLTKEVCYSAIHEFLDLAHTLLTPLLSHLAHARCAAQKIKQITRQAEMMELPNTTPADMAHSTDEVEFFRLMEAELKRGSR
jgi:hypothetical protein